MKTKKRSSRAPGPAAAAPVVLPPDPTVAAATREWETWQSLGGDGIAVPAFSAPGAHCSVIVLPPDRDVFWQHLPLAYRIARSLGNEDAAPAALQNAYRQFFSSPKSRPADLKKFLPKNIRWQINDAKKRETRRRAREEKHAEALPGRSLDPAAPLLEKEDEQRVALFMGGLTPRQAAVVRAGIMAGFNRAAAARSLGCSRQAVHKVLESVAPRARAILDGGARPKAGRRGRG